MDYSITSDDLRIFIPIVLGLISFIIFWFVQKSESIKGNYFKKYGEDMGSANFILFTKVLGGVSMGILPALGYFIAFPDTTFGELGIKLPAETLLATILLTLVLSILIVPLVMYSAKKPENLVNYPQIRAKIWDRKLLLYNLSAWAIYLLGYEFLFRGVLLFPLVDSIGLWPAIAVNIALYSGTHIPKGLSETIGAIPFAIILSLITIYTGTIWVAFIAHVVMAWTNSLTSLKHNPEMKFVNQ